MSSRAAGTSRPAIQPGTLLESGWLTRDDKDTVADYYFFFSRPGFYQQRQPCSSPTACLAAGIPLPLPFSPPGFGAGPKRAGGCYGWAGAGDGAGGAELESRGWGGREGGREAEREAGRQGGREGDALGGAPVPLRPAGGSQLAQPRSPVSQSPFQPLCGLLTGGGWSYIKAHYENYNIRPRACPRRQLGSFQPLSPRSAGPSCKISI